MAVDEWRRSALSQDHINVPSEAELGSIARQIDAAAAERQATEAEKSLVELRAEKLALEERVWKKQSDLATLRSSSAKGEKPLSEKESHAAVNAYSKMLREVKRRRSICLEMLSNVGEGTAGAVPADIETCPIPDSDIPSSLFTLTMDLTSCSHLCGGLITSMLLVQESRESS
eukprot:scaffold134174_cov37-Tisochrysis_lutea.AAC.2